MIRTSAGKPRALSNRDDLGIMHSPTVYCFMRVTVHTMTSQEKESNEDFWVHEVSGTNLPLL
jgi:hypothetical protein